MVMGKHRFVNRVLEYNKALIYPLIALVSPIQVNNANTRTVQFVVVPLTEVIVRHAIQINHVIIQVVHAKDCHTVLIIQKVTVMEQRIVFGLQMEVIVAPGHVCIAHNANIRGIFRVRNAQLSVAKLPRNQRAITTFTFIYVCGAQDHADATNPHQIA